MVYTICNTCGHGYHWEWIEAFSKFGFGDGDAHVETPKVAATLQDAGYRPKIWKWGVHNTLIVSLRKNSTELIPDNITIGYVNPREYLPESVIRLLDNTFPTTSIYKFP